MSRINSIFVAIIAAVLSAAVGCASSKPAEIAPQATNELNTLRTELFAAKAQVQEAANAARDLTDQPRGELTPQMQRLNTGVTALNNTRKQAKSQAQTYEERSDEYFAKWDQMLMTMSEDTAERGKKRMMLAQASVGRLRQDAVDIRANLNPFMAEINEANTYLTTDTTKSGLDVVKPKLQSAAKREPAISKGIDKMIADIDAIRDGK
jgi:hypothetical protein